MITLFKNLFRKNYTAKLIEVKNTSKQGNEDNYYYYMIGDYLSNKHNLLFTDSEIAEAINRSNQHQDLINNF